MKLLVTLGLALPLAAHSAQQDPERAETSAAHQWLLDLTGEWEVVGEIVPEEGQPAIEWRVEERARAIGELWLVIEGRSETEGEAYSSMMTVGYDPARETYVGTWIDSMQPRMWTYEGALDEDRRALTLNAEGPSMTDPTKTAKYRDRIELVNENTKRLVSSMQQEDGRWITFMTLTGRRVKR